MSFLALGSCCSDLEQQPFEIVERKGLGHPDTLADALADIISIAYSRYCLERFGVIPHHNLDKLYIGAGHFKRGFGSLQMISPVKVVTNGRISNTMDGQDIDVQAIQLKAVKDYLARVMPHMDIDQHLEVITNSTQNTQRDHWFSPRSLEDLPESVKATANDTSLCVAYAPLSICEALCLSLEQLMWVRHSDGVRVPRWPDIGQDIKVMTLRNGNCINVTLCVPFISTLTPSYEHYLSRLREFEALVQERAESIVGGQYRVSVEVNTAGRLYMLGIGSCIECGEEGVVGRGNSSTGVIASGRPFSMEAPYGKNLVYHTGRVMGYMTQRLTWAIFRETGLPNTVHALTINGGSLIPPHRLVVNTAREIDRHTIMRIVEDEFLSVDYVQELMKAPAVFRALDIAETFIGRR